MFSDTGVSTTTGSKTLSPITHHISFDNSVSSLNALLRQKFVSSSARNRIGTQSKPSNSTAYLQKKEILQIALVEATSMTSRKLIGEKQFSFLLSRSMSTFHQSKKIERTKKWRSEKYLRWIRLSLARMQRKISKTRRII